MGDVFIEGGKNRKGKEKEKGKGEKGKKGKKRKEREGEERERERRRKGNQCVLPQLVGVSTIGTLRTKK